MLDNGPRAEMHRARDLTDEELTEVAAGWEDRARRSVDASLVVPSTRRLGYERGAIDGS